MYLFKMIFNMFNRPYKCLSSIVTLNMLDFVALELILLCSSVIKLVQNRLTLWSDLLIKDHK